MTATDTHERTDLDVDLDLPLTCYVDRCDRDATWRIVAVHGSACGHGFYCARHKWEHDLVAARALDRGSRLVCKRHKRPATYRWEPLT